MKETKKLKLTSMDPTSYSDIEVECYVIKEMKDFVENYIEHLKNKGAFPREAIKTATVEARPAQIGEKVTTIPRVERDGKIYAISETENQVTIEGSMIVKNPDGEEYIVKPEIINDPNRYEKISEGVYKSVGAKPITFIIIEDDIVFPAPWGGEMYALKGAALNITNIERTYAIQNEAFNKTYKIISEKGKDSAIEK